MSKMELRPYDCQATMSQCESDVSFCGGCHSVSPMFHSVVAAQCEPDVSFCGGCHSVSPMFHSVVEVTV